MHRDDWWISISTDELLEMRRRIITDITKKFGGKLGPDVEDVVQKAFTTMFARRSSLQTDRDGLYRYLWTVARNEALDRIGTAERRRGHLPEVVHGQPRAAPRPEQQLEAREEHQKILKIFSALGEEDRLILWMHVVQGKKIRALARELGLNWHRVAAVVDKTLRQIRRELDRGPWH